MCIHVPRALHVCLGTLHQHTFDRGHANYRDHDRDLMAIVTVTVTITFAMTMTVTQIIRAVGGCKALGDWDPAKGIELRTSGDRYPEVTCMCVLICIHIQYELMDMYVWVTGTPPRESNSEPVVIDTQR